MGMLSVISGRKLVQLFETLGWVVARRNGSHIIMIKKGEVVTLSIPNHREVAKGTLRSLLRSSGMTIEEYNSALTKLG